ncbi:MAG: prolyl oligopeptidase family serine peptidase [Planctomycetaceae bacterium]
MKYLSTIFSLVLLVSGGLFAQEANTAIERLSTPDGVAYGLWNTRALKPAPTLIILAGTIDSTLEKPYFRQCGNELAEHGYLCVSIDIPCHGVHSVPTRSGLAGWAQHAIHEEDFVADNNVRLSAVLNHLIETGRTDPNQIAVCGTSRGGFLALHFAAHDERVRCVAAFAPVTDLAGLSEFRGHTEHPFVKQLSAIHQADKLAGRPVWIVIGDQDERVGTHHAIDLAAGITAASRKQQRPSQVELQVMPEPRGHTTPVGSSQKAAAWILKQLPESVAADSVPDHSRNAAESAAPRTLLLVDDHHVLYRSGTKRVFHPSTINPTNPVIREDQPWEMAIGWTSVLRHPETGKFMLWYQAYAGGRDARKSHKCVVCYAESEDGLTFTKPVLGIHDFDGQRSELGMIKATNIVLLGDNGYGDRYANSVLFEPTDPDPAKRYKMLYTDFSQDDEGHEWPGFHAAFSPDGIHWTKSDQNPLNRTAYGGRSLQPPFQDEDVYVEAMDTRKNFLRKTWKIPLSMSDAADVMYDPIRKRYVAYGKAWIQGPDGGLAWKHAMARVDSTDFLNWSDPQVICSPDDLDPPNTEFHTSPVFHHNGCYFCLNQILSARGEAIGAKADAMHIELMISRDGEHWERPFRDTPFIASTEQDFSNGGIFTNSTPVILNDEIRFYYGGYNSGAIGGGAKLTDASQQSGVGFSTLPLDRFAGIRPVALSAQSTLKKPLENTGQVTLKPVSLSSIQQVSINADARGGEILVEILDEDGYRIRGFSRDDAVPFTGDSVQQPVTWKGKHLSDLPQGKHMLRLHLHNAEVFAVTLK